jgi:hypothetical protein
MSASRHSIASGSTKEFLPFRLDAVNECLWRHRDDGEDEQIRVPPKAFAFSRNLVERAGRLVTQDELLEALWPETCEFLHIPTKTGAVWVFPTKHIPPWGSFCLSGTQRIPTFHENNTPRSRLRSLNRLICAHCRWVPVALMKFVGLTNWARLSCKYFVWG